MANHLRLDPDEYLENKRIAVCALEGSLDQTVYRLIENQLRNHQALVNKVLRLSSSVWIQSEKGKDDPYQRERHAREMDSVFEIIEEDMIMIDAILKNAVPAVA